MWPSSSQDSKDSVAFTNPEPAKGGSAGETVRQVRENALAYFQAQSRVVTKEDYIVRAYSLPAKFGSISKVHFVQDDQLNKSAAVGELERTITENDIGSTVLSLQAGRIPNPLAMNMYTLGYDSGKKLTTLSDSVKRNLKTYISQFRMVTDAINIKDAYVINVAVNFAILTKAGFNKQDVLLRCVNVIQDFFEIDRWQIGQPIVVADIAYEVSLVDGVATIVPPVENNPTNLPIVIENKYSVAEGYSGNFFDINTALKEGVVYPSLDPSIFEVKFPNSDIKGKVLGDNLGIQE